MNTTFQCRNLRIDLQTTQVMGILNMTPDSFSDGGKYNQTDAAFNHALSLIEDGAGILDIGGESTRPGYTQVSDQEEIDRITPIIEKLSTRTNVPLSVDTYKSKVAEQALVSGAHIINDIWGAKKDPEIADVAVSYQAPIILMHNREEATYENFIRDVLLDLYESINIAKKAGVSDNQIILDPGIGFAKTHEQNIEMMRNLDKIVGLGYPVLLATSNKRMIGNVLNLPVEERLEGTGATVCYGIQQGCHIVRVHSVKEIARMTKMMDALVGNGELNG